MNIQQTLMSHTAERRWSPHNWGMMGYKSRATLLQIISSTPLPCDKHNVVLWLARKLILVLRLLWCECKSAEILSSAHFPSYCSSP